MLHFPVLVHMLITRLYERMIEGIIQVHTQWDVLSQSCEGNNEVRLQQSIWSLQIELATAVTVSTF